MLAIGSLFTIPSTSSSADSTTREFTNVERPASPATGDKWPTFWADVSDVFPGICPDHVRRSAPNHNWDAAGFIAHTLDQQEAGHSYPTKAPAQKRKRAGDEDEESGLEGQIKNQGNHSAQRRLARRAEGFPYLGTYAKASFYLLQIAFPGIYVRDIESAFKENQLSLHHTYLAFKEDLSKPEHERRFKLKKVPTKSSGDPNNVHHVIRASGHVDPVTKRRAEEEALAEFNAIHGIHLDKEKREADRGAAKDAEAERERLNEQRAIAEGTMGECQCCFGDYPKNRMVDCTADTPHWVCYECAKNFARSKVGMSQWEINCFAIEDCPGTFAHSQRTKFLDENLRKALDRLEQEHVLQQAGIDLAQCPFCPYAAEYPPVEVNKEFSCENPDCGAVTCRLCKALTHIPKSCQEVKSENAAESARHRIEEDMTLAMLRKCNKCQLPYVKENGCNKIVCTKCRTVQCYICQQTIKDYTHFRVANTPCYDMLHDNVDGLLTLEVEKAEKAAREKILGENVDIREDHLGFKFSATVQKEMEARHAEALAADEKRRARGARPVIPPELLGGANQAEAAREEARRLGMMRDVHDRQQQPPPAHRPRRDQRAEEQSRQPAEEPALQDYQIQLMNLENRNQARLRLARMGLPPDQAQQNQGQVRQNQLQDLEAERRALREQQARQARQNILREIEAAEQALRDQQALDQHARQAERLRLQVQQAELYAQQVQQRTRHQVWQQARQQTRAVQQAIETQQRAVQEALQLRQQAQQQQPNWAGQQWPNQAAVGRIDPLFDPPIDFAELDPPVGFAEPLPNVDWQDWQPNMGAPGAQLAAAPPAAHPALAGAYYERPVAQAMPPMAAYPVDGLPQVQMGMNMRALPIRTTPPRVVIDLTGDDGQQVQQPLQVAGLGHNIPVDFAVDWGF